MCTWSHHIPQTLRCAACETALVLVGADFIPHPGHGWAACRECRSMLQACPNDPGVDVDGLVADIGLMLGDRHRLVRA